MGGGCQGLSLEKGGRRRLENQVDAVEGALEGMIPMAWLRISGFWPFRLTNIIRARSRFHANSNLARHKW